MLEDLSVVGISWRHNGSEGLERYALDEDKLAETLRDFADRAGLAISLRRCLAPSLVRLLGAGPTSPDRRADASGIHFAMRCP